MRALAVVAVMVYHANHSWLSGGFLGVEVFFVISGYLITLLLIGEHERNGRVDLGQFWLRRFRRLLPAVLTMMGGVAVYMALFNRQPQGRTRGDFLGGLFYGSNWYQIFVGQGYTAGEAFVPLRHLWSLAVEEQFYLIWPLVMVGILHLGRNRLPRVALWLFGISAWISLMVAVLFAHGDVPPTCSPGAMNGYWKLFGRCVSVNEALYLGTFSRAGGLLMGAAFAMVWRPMALLRGPARNKSRQLDLLGIARSRRPRAAGVEHLSVGRRSIDRHALRPVAVPRRLLPHRRRHADGDRRGHPPAGTAGSPARQPGVQLGRHAQLRLVPVPLADLPDHPRQAGVPMTCRSGSWAMAFTLPITEASYRFIEMPDPAGPARRMAARRAASAHRGRASSDVSERRLRHRQRCAGRVRRRQHRDGRQPVRRPDRVRQ